MADFGYDVSTYPDGLDPTFTPIDGPRVLIEQLARMLETPEGLHDDDPEFAYLLADAINSPQSPRSIGVLQGKIASKLELHDLVASADVDVTFSPATRALRAAVRVVAVDGETSRFVLAIDGVTAELLEGEG